MLQDGEDDCDDRFNDVIFPRMPDPDLDDIYRDDVISDKVKPEDSIFRIRGRGSAMDYRDTSSSQEEDLLHDEADDDDPLLSDDDDLLLADDDNDDGSTSCGSPYKIATPPLPQIFDLFISSLDRRTRKSSFDQEPALPHSLHRPSQGLPAQFGCCQQDEEPLDDDDQGQHLLPSCKTTATDNYGSMPADYSTSSSRSSSAS
jgi:hypothetical protein